MFCVNSKFQIPNFKIADLKFGIWNNNLYYV
jgi:hypothetical protein